MALYYAASFVGKTVVTDKKVPVYSNVNTDKILGYIEPRTALPVYSYLEANPTINRPNNWFMFLPSSGNPYYIPIIKGYFDVDMFEQSGIKTALQVDKEKAEKLNVFGVDNTPDGVEALEFDDYIGKYLPLAATVVAGYFILKHGIPYLLKKM